MMNEIDLAGWRYVFKFTTWKYVYKEPFCPILFCNQDLEYFTLGETDEATEMGDGVRVIKGKDAVTLQFDTIEAYESFIQLYLLNLDFSTLTKRLVDINLKLTQYHSARLQVKIFAEKLGLDLAES